MTPGAADDILERQPLAIIRGLVIVGEQQGRKIGFPTANIGVTETEVNFGVYAGFAAGHRAAVSVGVRPTFGAGLKPLAEAYLLDFDGDLYGRELEIRLMVRLRDEIRFDSVEALTRQIEDDVARVRSLL